MKEELETLLYLYDKAKKMHLNKFKFNGTFITFDVAKKRMKDLRNAS